MTTTFEFRSLSLNPDYCAPDTSEIRLLPTFDRGGLCHCTLPVGEISKAVSHKTVDEIWYCLSGSGEIWQRGTNGEAVKEFTIGDSFTIPVGNSFQFRNTGSEPLRIIISTMPKWLGADEAVEEKGKW